MANNISGINPTGTPSSIDVLNAGEQAISFTEQLPNLTAKLREALTSKFNESPLYPQRETAVQGFLNQPTQTRQYISGLQQRTGVPLAPTQQQAIESARRSAAYVPLATNTLMMGSAYGGLEDMVQSGTEAFTSAAEAQTKRADLLNTIRQQEIENQLEQQKLALSASGASTASGRATNILNQVAQAARGGSTLKEIMQNYGTSMDVTPNDIYRVYNTNSKWGPAKETEAELQRLYGVKPASTAEQRNRQAAFGVTTASLDDLLKTNLSGVGTFNADIVQLLSGIPVARKLLPEDSQNLISLNQQYALIRQNVLRAFQGGRISDQDYKQANEYIPSITEPAFVIKTKLTNLKNLINNMNAYTSDEIVNNYDQIMDEIGI